MERPTIFISCGQVSTEEKALGQRIRDLIDANGVFQGYFAQNQSSLDGLTRHIFSRIHTCFGLVCVMHERGHVSSPHGNSVRASVWIEQEIAIAAFLTEVLGKNIHVRVYSKKGIKVEGVRDKLLINPTEFTTDDEVLADLIRLLEEWSQGLETPEKKESSQLEKLLVELNDNREILSLDLSNFQPLEENAFRDLKTNGALELLAPGLKDAIKQTYLVMANYSTCLQRIQNIQQSGQRANAITSDLSPAKRQALKCVSGLIYNLKQLLGKSL